MENDTNKKEYELNIREKKIQEINAGVELTTQVVERPMFPSGLHVSNCFLSEREN